MRARVEARRLQVVPHVGDDRRRFRREGDGRVQDQPVDVVDPKANTFQVEGADGSVERLGLLDETREPILLRRCLQQRQKIGDAGLCGLTVVCGHDR